MQQLYDELRNISDDYGKGIEDYLIEGVSLAKEFLLSANGPSELVDCIDYTYYNNDYGEIYINGTSSEKLLSIYMEYGTGYTGQSNPHRRLSPDNYDLNDHGYEGWVYFNEKYGKFVRTTGMIPKAYMYKTYLTLRRQILQSDDRLSIEFVVGDEYTSPSIIIRRLRNYSRT